MFIAYFGRLPVRVCAVAAAVLALGWTAAWASLPPASASAAASGAATVLKTSPGPHGVEDLSAALAGEMTGAHLTVSRDPSGGSALKAVVTLPSTLSDAIKAEAANAGIARTAQSVSVTARLSGEGYDVTPTAPQSAKLAQGQTLAFEWLVTPAAQAKGPLTAEIKASLEGEGAPVVVPLASLSAEAPAVPVAAAPAKGASGFKLPDLSKFRLSDLKTLKLPDLKSFHLKQLQIPGHKTIDVPGLGPQSSDKVVTLTILVVIVILLLLIARNAAARRQRAERRRRFRTYEATSFGDLDEFGHDGHQSTSAPEPEDSHSSDHGHGHGH